MNNLRAVTRGQNSLDICNNVLKQLMDGDTAMSVAIVDPTPFPPGAIEHLHDNNNWNRTPLGSHDASLDDAPKGVGGEARFQLGPGQKDRNGGPSSPDVPTLKKMIDGFNLSDTIGQAPKLIPQVCALQCVKKP